MPAGGVVRDCVRGARHMIGADIATGEHCGASRRNERPIYIISGDLAHRPRSSATRRIQPRSCRQRQDALGA